MTNKLKAKEEEILAEFDERIRCPNCESGIVYNPVWKEFYEKHPNPTDENLKEFFGDAFDGHIVKGIPEEYECERCGGRGERQRTREELKSSLSLSLAKQRATIRGMVEERLKLLANVSDLQNISKIGLLPVIKIAVRELSDLLRLLGKEE